jgi:hypothetical protein
VDKQKLESIIDLEQGLRTSITEQTQLLETLTPEEAKIMNNLVYKRDNTIWDWSKGFPSHSIGLNTANCPVKMLDIDSVHLDRVGRVWLFEHKFIYRGIEDNQ